MKNYLVKQGLTSGEYMVYWRKDERQAWTCGPIGSLLECEAFIRLHKKGYFND